jgi:membrane-associated phospholipid phosphatase
LEFTKRALFVYTRLFDPFVVICTAYIFVFLKSGEYPQDLFLFLFVIAINLAIPIIYFLKLLKEKKVGNWDVTNQKERRKLFGPLIIFISISTVVLYSFTLFTVLSPSGTLLFKYLLKIQIAGILLFSYLYIISPFLKSSGHVGTMAVFYLFTLKIFGFGYFWIIILILFQAVARVKLKKHTVPEVIAGFISGILIGGLVFFS